MLAYAVRRLAATVPVMLVVAVFVFSLLHLSPGDPAIVIAGDQASPTDVARIRETLGLDRPYLEQFVGWLGRAVRGDLGQSIFSNLPVSHLIAQRIEPTLMLMLLTVAIAVSVAVPLGVLAAWTAGRWIDRVLMAAAVLGFSVPVFVTGYLLAWLFALQLEWLPVQGYVPLAEGLWACVRSLLLPALALGSVYVALIARVTRATMLEVLGQDYMRTARAKGLGRRDAAMRHALRNAFLPVLSYLGPATAFAVTGSFVVEKVFAVPGIGQHFVDAVLAKDITLLLGVVLVLSTAVILLNLAVDVAYAWVDPRIQSGRA